MKNVIHAPGRDTSNKKSSEFKHNVLWKISSKLIQKLFFQSIITDMMSKSNNTVAVPFFKNRMKVTQLNADYSKEIKKLNTSNSFQEYFTWAKCNLTQQQRQGYWIELKVSCLKRTLQKEWILLKIPVILYVIVPARILKYLNE